MEGKSTNLSKNNGSLFYACLSTIEHKNNIWVLDSGFSKHMTWDESNFTDMGDFINSQLKMGNESLVNTWKGIVENPRK